ncbi:MAG: phosphoenolpyruvate--protein phosphotransferase [Opitutales bacterium]|nr:phosphoenolpyruvate--protein phosphotransferase [Opitutales bacterium]
MGEDFQKQEFRLQGVGCSPGVVRGKAFVFLQRSVEEIPCYKIEPASRDAEVRRFEKALESTRTQIAGLAEDVRSRGAAAEADIFDAHLLVLDDPAIVGETLKAMSATGLNAEYCFNSTARRYIEFFAGLEDDYLKERVSDIRDVTQRVLKNLLGVASQGVSDRFTKRVIVAEDLTPSETTMFERSNVLALLTDMGNRTSHAAIVARAMGIPAVVGLRNASLRIAQDDDVLIDGEKGIVYINPSEKTLACYTTISRQRSRLVAMIEKELALPDVTEDGRAFHLEGNISGADDVESLKKFRLENVGLFRSEGIFLRHDRFPDEEQQFEEYRRAAEALPKTGTLVIRTLDLGGDKLISSSLLAREDNPFMGFRAIRFCLEFRDIFKDQLRAILRASAFGKMKIMFPMISSVAEVVAAKEILEEAKDELRSRGEKFDEDISVGAMIEIPAAAVIAEDIAEEVDFFSIGTNDLTQYTLAVDRGNEKISHLYDPYHPAVLKLIYFIVKAARKAGIPCAVCGEIAGDPAFAPLLLGMGVSALSMTPSCAAKIRYILRHTSFDTMQTLARTVLAEPEPRNIQERLTLFINSILPDSE